ncbi:hypothetical protein [Marinimicrobium sp. C2-29]|uniref:hypothetical protein n=1 Tax=Marinimicrobium sp. C2-29 TaxID=3139825 RepID=UPI003139D10E
MPNPLSQTQANSASPGTASALESPRLPFGWLTGALLCAFGIWMLPSVLMVFLAQTRPDLSVADLLTLLALTGVSATVLRLTIGFWLQTGFGRALVFWALLVLLMVSLAVAGLMAFGGASGWNLAGLSVLAGLGGGGLAALSGPSALPDEETQYELEAASLVGHLGMVLTLLLVPYALLWPLPALSGAPLISGASHFLGRVPAGAPVWLGWSGVLWALACAGLLGVWYFLGRNGVPLWVPQWRRALLAVVLGLLASALVARVILPVSLGGLALAAPAELVLSVLLALCILIILVLTPAAPRRRTTQLLAHRHLWVMSALWVASLGTFLGLTLVFPLLTSVLFRLPGDGGAGYPGVFLYAWMLPMAAILMRPLGSWAARRWGGMRVVVTSLLSSMLGAGWLFGVLVRIGRSDYPPDELTGYLLGMGGLFMASGLGHAALVQTLPRVFPPSLRPGASVWLMSVATLGMAYIPLALVRALNQEAVHQAFLGFAVYFFLCALLACIVYLRRHASVYNP